MEKIFTHPNNCPYPNLFYEIQLGNAGHFYTYCKYANVTERLMTSILNGKGDFTLEEKRKLINVYWNTGIEISHTYLYNSKLSFYDLKKKKHYHKFAVLYNELNELVTKPIVYTDFRYRNYYTEFSKYIEQRYVCRADYNKLVNLVNIFKLISRKTHARDI